MFGLSELAILLVVVALVLGARRLPDLARSAGRSARILKAEARTAKNEDTVRADGAGRAASGVVPGEVVARDGGGTTGGTGSPLHRA